MVYLANLCFDCRDCYYACQFAPPHEFAVNVLELCRSCARRLTANYSWPAILRFVQAQHRGRVLITGVSSLVIIFFLVLGFMGRDVLFATHLGEGAFYRVVPYVAMTLPPLMIALYGFSGFVIGGVRASGARPAALCPMSLT